MTSNIAFLIIIGDKFAASAIGESLRDEKHTVRVVADWETARAHLAQAVPDVIIANVDATMNTGDWMAVTLSVHNDINVTLVLMALDYIPEDSVQSSEQHLFNPVNIERIRSIIRRYDRIYDDTSL